MNWDIRLKNYHQFFRRNRMKWFEQNFNIRDDTKILDVGGEVEYWSYIKYKPQITILNVFESKRELPSNFSWVVGDGRKMDFQDKEFDVVFSNSVIEHIKRGEEQDKFAKEIMRVGKSFFVQEPYKYAIVDSHYMTVFVHWLPKIVQHRILRYTSVWGLVQKPDRALIEHCVNTTDLPSVSEMKRCFPGCKIRKERFLFLPKALIAYKTPATA